MYNESMSTKPGREEDAMTQPTRAMKGVIDGRRPPPHRRGLLAVASGGLAALGLLVAGCGGGSPAVANVASSTTTAATATHSSSAAGGSAAGGSSAAAGGGGNHTVIMVGNAVQGAKLSACMRRHGVANFPDPNPQGMIQFGSEIDPHSPAFRSALSACQKLLPHGLEQPTPAQLAQLQQQLLAFSACMRTHGIKDFPDPTGGGLPQIRAVGDLDPNAPRFQARYRACRAHLPAGIPAKALGGLAPPATSAGG
jgi:hypothetical protein